MEAFTSLIVVIAVCGVTRAILGLIAPQSQIKKITEVATNIIIMSVIVTEIISLINNLLN